MPNRKIAEKSQLSSRTKPRARAPRAREVSAEKRIVSGAEWSIASAKAKFSEVVTSAATAPQMIKRNGKAVAIVVGVDEWQRRTKRKGTLADFFLNSPLRGSNIDLERSDIEPRDVEL